MSLTGDSEKSTIAVLHKANTSIPVVMEERRAPISSAVINDNGLGTADNFDNTWREQVGDVRGFLICTGEVCRGIKGIIIIENLFPLTLENTDWLEADRSSHFFLLLPSENVVQVDVYAKDRSSGTLDEETVVVPGHNCALRFRTKLQVNEWFGYCKGTLTQLKSPDEFCIHALYGSLRYNHCGKLGVLFSRLGPETSAKESAEQVVTEVTNFVRCCGGSELLFSVECDQPRAFVVFIDDYICGIAVASEDEYEAVTELDPSYHSDTEHWFVLAKYEYVNVVGFVVDDDRITAMRFRTNHRTSIC